MKGVIVFKGRYGATAQYANWLGSIIQLPVYESDELTGIKLKEFDYVIAGTSVYVGRMLLAKWIKANEKILAGKKLYLFIVCGTPANDVKALNSLIDKNIDTGLRKTIKTFFLRGRLIKSKLSFIDRLVLRMGASLQRNKADKERMLTDYDDVRQENLDEILNAVKGNLLVAVG